MIKSYELDAQYQLDVMHDEEDRLHEVIREKMTEEQKYLMARYEAVKNMILKLSLEIQSTC